MVPTKCLVHGFLLTLLRAGVDSFITCEKFILTIPSERIPEILLAMRISDKIRRFSLRGVVGRGLLDPKSNKFGRF